MRPVALLSALVLAGCGLDSKAVDTGTYAGTSPWPIEHWETFSPPGGGSICTATTPTIDTGTMCDAAEPFDTDRPEGDDVDNDGDWYTEEEGDCDDARSTVNPRRYEQCNGIDDDCNGVVDDYCPARPVLGWRKGHITQVDGGFVDGTIGFYYYNISGELLCQYEVELLDQGLVAPSCPDCLWAFALRGEVVGFGGNRCDEVDLDVEGLEEYGAQYEEVWGTSYYGYASCWPEQRTATGPKYEASQVVLTTSPYQDHWLSTFQNFAPEGDYQVTVTGNTVEWHHQGGTMYYRYP